MISSQRILYRCALYQGNLTDFPLLTSPHHQNVEGNVTITTSELTNEFSLSKLAGTPWLPSSKLYCLNAHYVPPGCPLCTPWMLIMYLLDALLIMLHTFISCISLPQHHPQTSSIETNMSFTSHSYVPVVDTQVHTA